MNHLLNNVMEAVKVARRLQRRPYAVLDFDNTCIENDIGEAVLAYMCEHRLLRGEGLYKTSISERDFHAQVFHHYYRLLSTGAYVDAYRLGASLFTGYTPDEASQLVRRVIAEEGATIRTRKLFDLEINRGLRRRDFVFQVAQALRDEDIPFWIVSASPEVAVREAMSHFQFQGKLVGVKTDLVEGRFTEHVLEPAPIGAAKVDCIKSFIEALQRPVLGVGDSSNDFAMMEYSFVRLAIDRENDLSHRAVALGWYVFRQASASNDKSN